MGVYAALSQSPAAEGSRSLTALTRSGHRDPAHSDFGAGTCLTIIARRRTPAITTKREEHALRQD
jgi:hypothetical protein